MIFLGFWGPLRRWSISIYEITQNPQITNFTKNTKIELWISYKIYLVSICSNYFQNFECILALLVYFVQWIVILNTGFGLCVFDCIWEHSLKKLNVLRFFENKKLQKCPRSVNNSRTDHFLIFWGICCPKWSPYVVEASLGRVVARVPKAPGRGGTPAARKCLLPTLFRSINSSINSKIEQQGSERKRQTATTHPRQQSLHGEHICPICRICRWTLSFEWVSFGTMG